MTKKDYIAFATIIRQQRATLPYRTTNDVERAIDYMERHCIYIFEEDNPNFDRDHFLRLCEPE